MTRQLTTANACKSALIEVVTEAMMEGEKVNFLGFGTFETVKRSQRNGRNPATETTVRASKNEKFHTYL